MDGPEFLVKLQELGLDIPVIVASSRERALIDTVREMGGVLGLNVLAAVQKPLQVETLRQALQNAPNKESKGCAQRAELGIDAAALSDARERPDLALEISSVQQCHGLAPEQIVTEITESSLVTRVGTALSVLVARPSRWPTVSVWSPLPRGLRR